MGDSKIVAKRFGENLRRVRKELGLSHEETGYRASLHRTEIGLLERANASRGSTPSFGSRERSESNSSARC